jgi:hypothetical protein
LRRYLWQPPRAHGEQPRKRVAGPLELFYDLAVVLLVAQDARHLAGHLTWPSRLLAPPSGRPALARRPGACSTPHTWPASEL